MNWRWPLYQTLLACILEELPTFLEIEVLELAV